MPTVAPARAGSRHKPRKMISLSTRQYEALKEVARRNQRPIVWEARIAINKMLVDAGVMTVEEAAIIDDDT